MTFQEFAQKKIVGVPVLYIGAGFVVILAVVAWRMKALPTEDVDGAVDPADATPDDDNNAGGIAGMADPYDGYETTGTVVVQPTVPSGEPADAKYDNNDEWVKDAAEWLVSSNRATGSDAMTALTKYVNGEDLSFDEGGLVNAAIKEKGQPPDPLTKIGTVGAPAARKQFAGASGVHTVQGANDNTHAKLAALYYGSSGEMYQNRIAQYNTGLGIVGTTFIPGTKVTIPAYTTTVYYTVTGRNGDNYFSYIAKRHGLTTAQVIALNPRLVQPFAKGTKVRVS